MSSVRTKMNVGDCVVVIGVPNNLKDDLQLKTREVLEKCVGRSFPIIGFDQIEGADEPLVRLDIGEVTGHESYMETIWIEPQFLRPAKG
jgi:hypothetical protein